jgi:small GTP-binding protein
MAELPVFKLVVVGNSGVGKSCLLLRFCDNQFTPSFVATVGIDFKVRTVVLSSGRQVRLQIWDTAGQDRFRAITSAYYRGAQGVLLVFAIDNQESFAALPQWLSELRRLTLTTNMLLVANKCDCEAERTVSDTAARAWADANALTYCQVSAKSGAGVTECFAQAAEAVQPSSQEPPPKLVANQGSHDKACC